MAQGNPGGQDTYVPLLELSGNLMIEYARNLHHTSLAINRACRVTPVKNTYGTYLQFNPLDLARNVNIPYDPDWAPGTLRPTGFESNLQFKTLTFRCDRKNHGKTLDKLGVDLANWPIMKAHTEALAQDAMTYRAIKVYNKMFDSTQYDATHVFSATTASGTGFLSGGTIADPRIKNAFDYAARIIMKDSMGKVQFGGLSVLMNHNTALKLSSTRELREYLAQQVNSEAQLRLDRGKSLNDAFGLPDRLYGYNVIVDSLFYSAVNKGNASLSGTPVIADNQILVCLADGPQEVPEGAPSYNTCHVFSYEEMTVESTEDTRNRLVFLDIVNNFTPEIVAPVTACLIQNIFS